MQRGKNVTVEMGKVAIQTDSANIQTNAFYLISILLLDSGIYNEDKLCLR